MHNVKLAKFRIGAIRRVTMEETGEVEVQATSLGEAASALRYRIEESEGDGSEIVPGFGNEEIAETSLTFISWNAEGAAFEVTPAGDAKWFSIDITDAERSELRLMTNAVSASIGPTQAYFVGAKRLHLLGDVLERAVEYRSALKMRQALADLVEWGARMGGWEAPEWDRARAILAGVKAIG